MNPPFGEQDFSEDERLAIQALLERKLGVKDVLTRPGPNNNQVPYVSAEWVVEEANKILGRDAWSSSVTQFDKDFLEEIDGKFSCGCSAMVRITLKNGVSREDIGYGVAHRQTTPVRALEIAKKVAVSDGLKRALKQFGNGLGNGLLFKPDENGGAGANNQRPSSAKSNPSMIKGEDYGY